MADFLDGESGRPPPQAARPTLADVTVAATGNGGHWTGGQGILDH